MLVNVGIKTYMILKLLRNPKMKTYIEMLANVGKCWHKNLYIFKIGCFGCLKGVFKNLRKPQIKKHIEQKEVLKGGIVPLYYVVRTSRRHCTYFFVRKLNCWKMLE